MIAYLQGANGEELELLVTMPDPADETFVIHIPDVDLTKQAEGYWWIRVTKS